MTFYEEFNGPWLHLVTLDVSSIADRVLSLAAHEKETAVRVVRGMKMSTEERIFDEFSAAFQFPYYFGENWDAFNECINDLSWLPARRYLTVVTNADELLRSTDQARVLCEILNDAGREWSQPATSTRPWAPEARAFHVVFQANPDRASIVADMLAAAAVPHDRRQWT